MVAGRWVRLGDREETPWAVAVYLGWWYGDPWPVTWQVCGGYLWVQNPAVPKSK